jgi:hypothetical protein
VAERPQKEDSPESGTEAAQDFTPRTSSSRSRDHQKSGEVHWTMAWGQRGVWVHKRALARRAAVFPEGGRGGTGSVRLNVH